MTKSDLTIISVAANETGFIDFMIKSVYAFTDPKPNFIICDNGQNGKRLEKYRDDKNIIIIKNKRARKHIRNNKVFSTSVRHGIGLNIAFQMVKTDRVAIIESDCVVLCDNWDKISNGYEMKACVKGPGVNQEHYYYPCFMVFYTKCMNRNGRMNFAANDRREGKGVLISSKSDKRYSDVGWRVYEHISHQKVEKLQFVRCNNNSRSKEFNKRFSHKTNVFLDNYDNIIGSHFWRGSNPGSRQNNNDRKKWFSIVRKFINKKNKSKIVS